MSEPVPSKEGEAAKTSSQKPPSSVDVPRVQPFIPLECDPELMTTFVHGLGLSGHLSFYDVLSIYDRDLLAFTPRPAHALLLVFPISEQYEKFRVEEDADKPEYEAKGVGEDPVWFKQTIRNACGLIAVLHAISNGAVRAKIEPKSVLDNLLIKALPLPPLERAKVLEDSQELARASKSAATRGTSRIPNAEEDVDLHFVCFVKSKDNHIYELDGRRKGPLDRGFIGEDDILSNRALDIVQTFTDREKSTGRLDFSLIALAPTMEP